MEIIKYPSADKWQQLSQRALADKASEVKAIVADIIANVVKGGDAAIKEYEQRFTGASLDSLAVSDQEIAEASMLVSDELKEAIETARKNIEVFHKAQATEVEVITAPGVKCIQRQVPITKVGLYVPGGNSPLFSTVLMLAVPAVGIRMDTVWIPCGILYGICGIISNWVCSRWKPPQYPQPTR